MPLTRSVRGLACVFVGRGPEPRPEPSSLVPLLPEPGTPAPQELPMATLRQIHSNRCVLVEQRSEGVIAEGDAMVTALSGQAMGIATADCLPIVAIDPVARALAVVHAGWRGTLAGVLPAALSLMSEALGARPERTLVGIGPAIGGCCYRVGDDVTEQFLGAWPRHARRAILRREGNTYLDLAELNHRQAMDAGVSSDRFVAAGICTACRPDRCHSFRREGPAAGRMWLLAAWLQTG